MMGQRPSEMADRAEAVLAVLSCARAEVIWWFQHWEEVRRLIFAQAQLLPAFAKSKCIQGYYPYP